MRGREARGTVLFLAAFALWQSLSTKRAKGFVLLLAAVYAMQLVLTSLASHSEPTSIMTPVLQSSLRGAYCCVPSVVNVFDAEQALPAHELHVNDKSERTHRQQFFMKELPNGRVAVSKWTCFAVMKNRSGTFSARFSIPKAVDFGQANGRAFMLDALPGVGFDPESSAQLECRGEAVPTTPLGQVVLLQKLEHPDQCAGATETQLEAQIGAGLQRANARFESYERANLLGQCLLCALLLAFYAHEWNQSNGFLSETVEVVRARLTLTKRRDLVTASLVGKLLISCLLLYRVSGFLVSLTSKSEVTGGCRVEDSFFTFEDNIRHFPCRSLNPLTWSVIWAFIYFISIFAFDWIIASNRNNITTCSKLLTHLPHVDAVPSTNERSGWCKLLCAVCSRECHSKALLFAAEEGAESSETVEQRPIVASFVSGRGENILVLEVPMVPIALK